VFKPHSRLVGRGRRSRGGVPAQVAHDISAFVQWIRVLGTLLVVRPGITLAGRMVMTWLLWLLIAACVAAFAAVTGIKPKHTKPIAGTHLMGVARVVLFCIVAILLWYAFKGR